MELRRQFDVVLSEYVRWGEDEGSVVGEEGHQAAARLLELWRKLIQQSESECTQAIAKDALVAWNEKVKEQAKSTDGNRFLKCFLVDFSFDIFDRLVDHLKHLLVVLRMVEDIDADASTCANQEYLQAIEQAFLTLSGYCSQKELYLLTSQLLSSTSSGGDSDSEIDVGKESAFFLMSLFPLQTCLLCSWGREELARGRTGNRHLAPALALLRRLLSVPDNEEEEEEGETSALNTFDLATLPLPLTKDSCSNKGKLSPYPGAENFPLPPSPFPTFAEYVALARRAQVMDEGVDSGHSIRRSGNSGLASRLPGVLLLLRSLCLAWLQHTQRIFETLAESSHAIPHTAPASGVCEGQQVLVQCQEEQEALTVHLLSLLTLVAFRCSAPSPRAALCTTLTALLTVLNSTEPLHSGERGGGGTETHPYVTLPLNSGDGCLSVAGGSGVSYLLNHPLRVRHAIMHFALRNQRMSSPGNSSFESSSQLFPVSSAQKKSLELSSESDEAKKVLFNKVWSRHCVPPLQGQGTAAALVPAVEAMLPWSAVTPAAWKKARSTYSDGWKRGRESLHKSLRLRRGGCLDWSLLGIALFAYYYYHSHQEENLVTAAASATSTATIAAISGNDGGVVWSVQMLEPVCFLLLAHPVLQAHEGLHCAAMLPLLPSRLGHSSLPVPLHTASTASSRFGADCDDDDSGNSLLSFRSYTASTLSFDWKEDVLAAYLSVRRGREQERKEYVEARQQCLYKGVTAITLQNCFTLCQFLVNAIVHSSDRLTQRGSQLALRWAIFHHHSIAPSSSSSSLPTLPLSPPPPLTPSCIGTEERELEYDSVSFLLLRRLVDMCPFPQAKGLLTDIAKDCLPYVSPFRSPGPGTSFCISNGDSRTEQLPPPPLLPRPTTAPTVTRTVRGTDQLSETHAQEQWEELQAVRYSEQLDQYLAAYVTRLCKRKTGSSDRAGGGVIRAPGATRKQEYLPLRVVLELFVLPALDTVYALREEEEEELLREILEHMDWFSSAVSLLRLVMLKLPHVPHISKEGGMHLQVSDTFPSISHMLATCRDLLETQVQRLKGQQLGQALSTSKAVSTPETSKKRSLLSQGGAESNSLKTATTTKNKQQSIAQEQAAVVLKLELVLMNMP